MRSYLHDSTRASGLYMCIVKRKKASTFHRLREGLLYHTLGLVTLYVNSTTDTYDGHLQSWRVDIPSFSQLRIRSIYGSWYQHRTQTQQTNNMTDQVYVEWQPAPAHGGSTGGNEASGVDGNAIGLSGKQPNFLQKLYE